MLTEAEAIQRITAGRFEFPPLEVVAAEPDPGSVAGGRPDLSLELGWQQQTERFLVEYRSLGTPRRLQEAIAVARSYEGPDRRPMVMAPFLDEEWLERLADAGISGLDFSGNGVVVVPGRWFVFRTGRPNAFPSGSYIQDIYRGRSSFVPRVLLVRPDFDQVTAVREEILRRGGEVSLSTVSKVLSRLEEDLLISREDGVELIQPARLLDRFVDAYSGPDVRRRTAGRVPDVEAALRRALETAEREGVALVGKAEGVYAPFPGAEGSVTLFTDDVEALLPAIGMEETRRFPDIELVETDEESVYFDARRRDGFVWTSPVETYLQLAAGGKREQEVAEQLRDALLSRTFD